MFSNPPIIPAIFVMTKITHFCWLDDHFCYSNPWYSLMLFAKTGNIIGLFPSSLPLSFKSQPFQCLLPKSYSCRWNPQFSTLSLKNQLLRWFQTIQHQNSVLTIQSFQLNSPGAPEADLPPGLRTSATLPPNDPSCIEGSGASGRFPTPHGRPGQLGTRFAGDMSISFHQTSWIYIELR